MRVHFTKTFVALNRRAAAKLLNNSVPLGVRIGVKMLFPFAELIKRGLCKVNVPLFDQRTHKAEEKRQQQCADMRTVNIGIRHNDDLAVTQLFNVKIVADPRAERRNDRHQLIVAVNAVQPRFFHVEHFAPERQDCLKAAVASSFGGAACGIALYDVDLGLVYIAGLTIRQLSRQRRRFHRRFALYKLAGFFCRFARARGGQCLVKNSSRRCGVFLQICRKLFRKGLIHQGADLRIAQARLCLPFKLCFLDLDTDDRGKPFAHILAAEIFVAFLQNAVLSGIIVHHTG